MRRLPALAIGSLGVLAALAGCKSTEYRMNPTPGVNNLSMTQDEIDNRLTIVNDTNFRSMSDDIGRLMLMDKPSDLRPGPPAPY